MIRFDEFIEGRNKHAFYEITFFFFFFKKIRYKNQAFCSSFVLTYSECIIIPLFSFYTFCGNIVDSLGTRHLFFSTLDFAIYILHGNYPGKVIITIGKVWLIKVG